MQELISFIYRRRAFFTFILLELIALWFLFNRNSYQHFAYLSTANWVNARVYEAGSNTRSYFDLKSRNDSLLLENALLRNALYNEQPIHEATRNPQDTASYQPKKLAYNHLPAKVINNSIRFVNNYLTINKGTKDGLVPGMGIITSNGIAGKIKASSDNFSVAYSLLHSNMPISSKLKGSGHLCSTKWDGKDYTKAKLLNLAMHIPVEVGDTVVTSGFNAVFPNDLMIGKVSKVEKLPNDIFQTVSIDLSTDFSNLDHVYVIKYNLANERDSLEQAAIE